MAGGWQRREFTPGSKVKCGAIRKGDIEWYKQPGDDSGFRTRTREVTSREGGTRTFCSWQFTPGRRIAKLGKKSRDKHRNRVIATEQRILADQNAKNDRYGICEQSKISMEQYDSLQIDKLVELRVLKGMFNDLETRISNNDIHRMLTEEDKRLLVWKGGFAETMISWGPDMVPTPPPWTLHEIAYSIELFIKRILKKVNKEWYGDRIHEGNCQIVDAGFKVWPILERKWSLAKLRKYNDEFFKKKDWKFKIRDFKGLQSWADQFRIKQFAVMLEARKYQKAPNNLQKWHIEALDFMKRLGLLVNITDKKAGSIVYSKDVFIKECMLHIEDGKGTYERLYNVTTAEIFCKVRARFETELLPFTKDSHGKDDKGFKQILKLVGENFYGNSQEGSHLPVPYALFKMHKPPVLGKPRSRLIVNTINTFTEEMANFVHCQLWNLVARHPRILKNTRELVAILDHKDFSNGEYWVSSADVTALYPSMVLSTCLESMKWFLDKFRPNLSIKAKEFLIILVRFIVTESFIIFEGIIY